MKIFSNAITGEEKRFLSDEHKALVEFYKAFITAPTK